MSNEIKFNLNGETVSYRGAGLRRLLDVLREDFALTSVKEGCGEGECGACAVLIDGKLVNSCLVPIAAVEGAKITTIEGFKKTEQHAALENAFAQAGAVQCGFCTPGFMLAAYALLKENPNPNEAEIRQAISGNLCRCTGYNMIVEAIQLAAKKEAELWQTQ